MARWQVGCDTCSSSGWIGPEPNGREAWCEGCQRPIDLGRAPGGEVRCPDCGLEPSTEAPFFVELYGELQNLWAVASAWAGDPAPLAAILPERPRYLTDLGPPEARDDDPEPVREALAHLLHGEFADARDGLEAWFRSPDSSRGSGNASGSSSMEARVHRALGIARQRTKDLSGAEEQYTEALKREPRDSAARLDRGALRAIRGDFAAAREDFDLAGDSREARWNRAALRVLEAVAVTPGLPDRSTIEAARASAGAPSDYWSDHTVGRLLWSALVERALAARADEEATRAERGAARAATTRSEAATLRAAEQELEFLTFWDRALVVHGYAALGMTPECAEAAAPLLEQGLDALLSRPAITGPAGEDLRPTIEKARDAVRRRQPGPAVEELGQLMAREDLQHYRVPCIRCQRGTLGVVAFEE